ncbi:Methylated-DNA--protein-cysteine methyltransferase [Alloactinosynnema sp. L-07]|uniref:methylated-DNA--[protein]-cysteine S-methyltransferase n=1 Tax=Alloactinosynnema sp. L-07 TaxID=1653480 RepID=UPI00065EF8CF|nr:methylated-DNA--[protein]-cysteine S-methyltransferase [Alloactinosynnema sp. L-07]CRK61627.1 Methylated-DNA--protein-cysteine methyltransferase [Alloactinosynnema sp. L-07]
MTAYSSTVDTQLGPFTAVTTASGAVLASGWTARIDDLLPVIHKSLRPSAVAPRADLGDVTKAIVAYHEGDLTAIDAIEVHQTGGEFLLHAWDILRTVPAGKPTTYMDYAALSGRPAAIRAAAMACARNAAALFVPCHRITRTGGGMGGFRWGIEIKRQLLAHES